MSLSRYATGREFQRHGPATESCPRDAFVFLLWHTSRHQPIAVIGGWCRSRADNIQPGTVEAAGRVTPCVQEQLAWSQCAVELVTSVAPGEPVWYTCLVRGFDRSVIVVKTPKKIKNQWLKRTFCRLLKLVICTT